MARTAAFPLQMMLFFFLLHIRGRPSSANSTDACPAAPNITPASPGRATPVVFGVMIGVEEAYALWSPSETHLLVEAQKQMP